MADSEKEAPPPAYDGTGGVAVPTPTPAPARSNGARAPLPLNLPALNMIRGKRVILASASPRRRQLLAQVRATSLSQASKQPPTFQPRSASQTSKSSLQPSPKINPKRSAPSNTSSPPRPKNVHMSIAHTLTTHLRKEVNPRLS